MPLKKKNNNKTNFSKKLFRLQRAAPDYKPLSWIWMLSVKICFRGTRWRCCDQLGERCSICSLCDITGGWCPELSVRNPDLMLDSHNAFFFLLRQYAVKLCWRFFWETRPAPSLPWHLAWRINITQCLSVLNGQKEFDYNSCWDHCVSLTMMTSFLCSVRTNITICLRSVDIKQTENQSWSVYTDSSPQVHFIHVWSSPTFTCVTWSRVLSALRPLQELTLQEFFRHR